MKANVRVVQLRSIGIELSKCCEASTCVISFNLDWTSCFLALWSIFLLIITQNLQSPNWQVGSLELSEN